MAHNIKYYANAHVGAAVISVSSMISPKAQTGEPADRPIVVLEWARHFAAECAGAIALYLILPTMTLIAVLLFGCLFNDVPIIPLCLIGAFLSVLVPLIFVRYYRARRRMRQVDRATNSISDGSNALILELSGSYTPYVIEAAEKLGDSHEPSVTPALLLVLEQAVAEQRPGWEDIAAALIEALGNLGDPRALSALESLRDEKGICTLPSLEIAINRLAVSRSHAQLLRPVNCDPTAKYTLLHPAAEQDSDDPASLVRAVRQ